MADVGDLLGPYRLTAVIGHGGFATVFKATHEGLGVERAVKILHQQYSDDSQIRTLFQREAQRAAQLAPANVVQVFDAGETRGEAWIASELMTGGTLAEAIQAGRHFTPAEVRHIGADLALALSEAHSLDILHRDVKPANIFMKSAGGAKLGDFGVAGELAGRAHASTMVGTVSYMSPEQDDGMATGQSDVYSLGAALFEAWTGSRSPAFARKEPTWPPTSEDDTTLRELIDAMLRETPEARPTAQDIVAILGGRTALAATLPPAARSTATATTPTGSGQPSGPRLPFRRSSRLWRATAFGIASFLVAAIGATAFAATSVTSTNQQPADEQAAASNVSPANELDDYGDDRGSAQHLVSNRGGTIETADDEDWFAFDARANRSYTFEAELLGLDGVSLRLVSNAGTGISSGQGFTSTGSARIRWETNSRVDSTHYLVVSGLDGAIGSYSVSIDSSSSATSTPTPVPTAAATTGTRWIAGTGGIGVKSRQDCTANAATSGSGLAQGTRVSLKFDGQGRCAGWYQVESANRRVWVEAKYLSTSEPTPVPQTGTAGTPPLMTGVCVDQNVASSADCRAAAANGISLAAMETYGITTWTRSDDVDAVSFAIDGKVIDFYHEDFSTLSLGQHSIQVYDPPGGEYEGWSTPLAFTIVR